MKSMDNLRAMMDKLQDVEITPLDRNKNFKDCNNFAQKTYKPKLQLDEQLLNPGRYTN